MDIEMRINGKPIPVKKAYNSVYPHAPQRTFIGSYVNISWIRPDTTYEIEISVPPVAPGRFLGLFVENVETEFTQRILAPPSSR